MFVVKKRELLKDSVIAGWPSASVIVERLNDEVLTWLSDHKYTGMTLSRWLMLQFGDDLVALDRYVRGRILHEKKPKFSRDKDSFPTF